jgi:hypothetical protein
MRLLTLEDTAQRLGVSPRSLADKRYRARIGLPGTKVGRRIAFNEGDVAQLIERCREPLPMSKEVAHVHN